MLAGGVEIRVGEQRESLDEGDFAIVEAGVWLAISGASDACLAVLLSDVPHAPFREAPYGVAEATHCAMDPPSALRRGLALRFDEQATFAPHLISSGGPGDLLLSANIGALGKAQTREIRRSCEAADRLLACLVVDLPPDEDPAALLMDRHWREILRELRPHYVAIAEDISSGPGRRRIMEVEATWSRKLAHEGFQFAVFTPLALDPVALLPALGWLGSLPPARIPLLLRLDQLPARIHEQRLFRALIPWVRAVVSPEEAHGEWCHFLDRTGYQGWVMRRS
jgi:hypothetical protein